MSRQFYAINTFLSTSFYQHPAINTLRFHSSGCTLRLEMSIWPFRGAPRTRFSDFSSFGTPRKRIFQIFRTSGLPDGSFSQKTTRRGIPKHCFSEFLPFGMPRSTIFPIFRSSLASETLFLAIFDEKPQATDCFRRFSHFVHERRMIFGVFSLSPQKIFCLQTILLKNRVLPF